jgi:uncharacterized protein
MELSRSECLALLATAGVGRIVYTEHALPAVRPVPFALDREEVVFPAGDERLAAAVEQTVVAFQADEIDDADGTGWSVYGVGEAYEVVDPDRVGGLASCCPAAAGEHRPAGPVIAIPLRYLSGRHFALIADGS